VSAQHLYRPGDSVIHRLAPECKLAATVAFVLAVVTTPRDHIWAFAAHALLLGACAAIARVPALVIARRALIEIPFILFAVLLPFIAAGERIDVLGVALSVEGLWAAWNIVAKATLGVVASILLAATTEPRALLLGVERLRMPRLLTQIAAFMIRYLDLILDEMRRMHIARVSRGFIARDVRHLPVLARSLATLFLRCYERAERVHLAMVSRGYTGSLPVVDHVRTPLRQWVIAAALPSAALTVALFAAI
jgi:cobalt/nickel transport system permease protein